LRIIILWNTIYMDAALNRLRAGGFDVGNEDAARLSPIGFNPIETKAEMQFRFRRRRTP
jgi:hypothetical protein